VKTVSDVRRGQSAPHVGGVSKATPPMRIETSDSVWTLSAARA
jgi:hypothetical protein